jgi:hypothetical protein
VSKAQTECLCHTYRISTRSPIFIE